MYFGSCLCGAITLTLAGEIRSIIHCHCSKCRKNSGTAYATNGFVNRADLTIRKGQEMLKSYTTSPGKRRFFCATCASPVYSENDADLSQLRLRLGILDSDIIERPGSHNFIGSKANWDDLDAALPRYDEFEPSRQKSK